MKRLSFILLCAMTIASCSSKYEMTNMEPKTIDVTEYVEEQGYIPVYDEHGAITALINPFPHDPVPSENEDLHAIWLYSYSSFADSLSTWEEQPVTIYLGRTTKYAYTYFVFDTPVDVYLTTITSGNDSLTAFVRYDGNMFFGPYDRKGWVIPDPSGQAQ